MISIESATTPLNFNSLLLLLLLLLPLPQNPWIVNSNSFIISIIDDFSQLFQIFVKKLTFSGESPDFLRFLSKNMILRKIFWGTPRFFQFVVKKSYFLGYPQIFSDFCQNSDISRNILWYPQLFSQIFVKKWFFWGTHRLFSDFCRKIWYLEKYFGVTPDSSHFLVKKKIYRQIKYFVVPQFFFIFFDKKLIFFWVPPFFSSLCQKISYFETYSGVFRFFVKKFDISKNISGYPLIFFIYLSKKMIFHRNLLQCYLFIFL